MTKELTHDVYLIFICVSFLIYWSKLESEVAQTMVLGMILLTVLFMVFRKEWKKKR